MRSRNCFLLSTTPKNIPETVTDSIAVRPPPGNAATCGLVLRESLHPFTPAFQRVTHFCRNGDRSVRGQWRHAQRLRPVSHGGSSGDVSYCGVTKSYVSKA